jgi:ParB family transcriptional regulator, chromosome partitioning protein
MPEKLVDREQVQQIEVDRFYPSPYQPRKRFDSDKLAELGQSMKTEGVINPIVVRLGKKSGTFEVLAGERRYRAGMLIRLKTLPAIVRELGDDAARRVVLIDNIQREDLSPVEEAAAIVSFVELCDGNVSAVAKSLGKSVTYVQDRVTVMGLPDKIRKMLDDGKLLVAQAKVIAEIPELRNQSQAAEMAADLNLSATQLHSRIQHWLPAKEPRAARPSPAAVGQAGQHVQARPRTQDGLKTTSAPRQSTNSKVGCDQLIGSAARFLEDLRGYGETIPDDPEERTALRAVLQDITQSGQYAFMELTRYMVENGELAATREKKKGKGG